MPISIMPTHNLSNFNRIIIKFCKTIILILELTKIFVNQIIMKSLKIKENNTIWKMKIEEDSHNKLIKMKKLKIIFTPIKLLKIEV